MKILKKDKIDRKIRNAKKAEKNLSQIRPEIEYDDLIGIFSCGSALLFLVALFAFLAEDYNVILYFWICFNILGISFIKKDYSKTKKRHYKAKEKNIKLIDKLNIENSNLSIEENYQEYFNELVQLKGSLKLEKIKPDLIQAIIEEYRKKDRINLPTLKNEDRIDQFINIELSKSLLIEKQNNQFMEIANN